MLAKRDLYESVSTLIMTAHILVIYLYTDTKFYVVLSFDTNFLKNINPR